MKTLLKKYARKWLSHYDYSFDTYLPITDKKILRNPFEYLPPELSLSPEQQDWLQQKEGSEDWTNDDFLRMQMFRLKRGSYWNDESHQYVLKYLHKITQQANELGIVLPINFMKFYKDRTLINRIRWDHDFSFSKEI